MNSDQLEFLNAVIPAAKTCEQNTGVPALITVAQAILESSGKAGWGMSELAQQYNNYFGVKATQAQVADHDYCEFPTAEYENGQRVMVKADFAQYATPTESFIAHGQLIANSPRYKAAMAVAHDPDAFAWALGPKTPAHPEGCGYSTAPQYHDLVMRLANEVRSYLEA